MKKKFTTKIFTTLFTFAFSLLFSQVFFSHAALAANAPGLDVGLVGHYTFDGKDLTQNARDSSGQGNNGFLQGIAATSSATVTGKVGQALSFNGTSQYVVATNSTSITSTQTTVSLWVKINSYPQANPRIFEIQDGSNSIQLIRDGGSGQWVTKHSQFQSGITGTQWGTPATGVWQHVVVVWDSVGNTTAFYINGIAQTGSANSNIGIGNQANKLYIAVRSDQNATTFFNGSIDDVRIYNRALSAAEVLQLYKSTASVVNTTVNVPNINTGLVGHWSFDGKDMLQNAKDSSGSGNNGFLQGITSTSSATVAGKVGQALSFNGTSQYVTIPDSTSLHVASAFTVSAWINQKTLQNYNAVVSKTQGNGNPGPFDSYIPSNGVFNFYIGNGSGNQSQSITATLPGTNTWVFITFLYTGSTMSIYVNGTLATGPTTVTVPVADGGQPVRIGSRNDGVTMMNGSIDDVRIYNRALSAAEVLQLYKSTASVVNTTVNVPNINTGLVGHWSFDGKDMLQNAKDSSGSGNNGNLQAFISTSSAMAAGKVGQAINFNVVNPHVDVPSSASFTTSAFTLSLWIKPTTTANWQGLIFKGTSSPYHFALAMNDLGSGHYRSAFFTDANGWSYDTTNTNNYGAWTHVVFTYDGTTGKFYANGSPGPSATLTVGSNTNTMSFGLWGSFPFKGLMDDVRIYNRALSAAEVLQLYKSTSATLK